MATEYFETIHPYMPIVSKLWFYRQLINPLSRQRADVALLLLCMRLVSMLVPDEMVPSRAPIYLAATQFYSELETMGDLSLQILQARVLISLYELGHAIYPAAYMTVGACARYGISLGLNRRGIYQVNSSHDWIEIEERKRVWWAVLILDRFVARPRSRIYVFPLTNSIVSSILVTRVELWRLRSRMAQVSCQ
jgi:hypothetical protein